MRSINLNEFINYSGGALGSDSEFDAIGKSKGFKNHIHYYHGNKTPLGNREITNEELQEGWEHILVANLTLLRRPDAYKDLLARNWFQVKNSEAIFAVGELTRFDTQVDGGTGWAVQMAIDAIKTVYVFDQHICSWFKYDYEDIEFKICEPPILTKNYAGIGTRKINELGKKAIARLYDDTLKFLGE
jgi:hypothetical protein